MAHYGAEIQSLHFDAQTRRYVAEVVLHEAGERYQVLCELPASGHRDFAWIANKIVNRAKAVGRAGRRESLMRLLLPQHSPHVRLTAHMHA